MKAWLHRIKWRILNWWVHNIHPSGEQEGEYEPHMKWVGEKDSRVKAIRAKRQI